MTISHKTKIELTEYEEEILDRSAGVLTSIYNGMNDFNLSIGKFNTEAVCRLMMGIKELQNSIKNYDDEEIEVF